MRPVRILSTLALSAAFALTLPACSRVNEPQSTSASLPPLCSDEWYRYVESAVPTGDGAGHGPDVGSDEWKSVVEFKLGIRGDADLPARDSEAWCAHIDELVRAR